MFKVPKVSFDDQAIRSLWQDKEWLLCEDEGERESLLLVRKVCLIAQSIISGEVFLFELSNNDG